MLSIFKRKRLMMSKLLVPGLIYFSLQIYLQNEFSNIINFVMNTHPQIIFGIVLGYIIQRINSASLSGSRHNDNDW